MAILLLSSFSLLFSFSFASSSPPTNASVIINTPLTPRNYGWYTFPLNFGTPQQPLRFSIDTSHSFSWFPCTRNYNCTRCNSSSDPHIPTFIPKLSTSYKSLSCNSPQCKMVAPDNKCKPKKECGYNVVYGEERTSGHFVSETLTVGGGLSLGNFIIGCSLSSYNMQGGGSMGFGRGPESLPSQLGLKSFSYCLVSYDNLNASSDLVLSTTGSGSCDRVKKIRYTPFLNNSKNVYYVLMQYILVGRVRVNVPDKYLKLNATGYGGTVVDTSNTLTWMVEDVYNIVFKEFKKQVGEKLDTLAKGFENPMGFDVCYKVSRNLVNKLPRLSLHFQGDAKMVVPMAKYYKKESVLCMCVNDAKGFGQEAAIVLGNYQQQDHYMKFDLENNRLGILPVNCANY